MSAQKKRADRRNIVVVGAGIVGASIAYHLSRRDVHLTVIDKGKPGSGTSGTSFAYLNAYGKEPRTYHDLNRRSMDLWDRFANRLGSEVGLRWGGKLLLENTPEGAAELLDLVGRLQSWGYSARVLDKAEVRSLEPKISIDGMKTAVYCENEGQVDPPKVVEACLDKARAGGAVVLTDTLVTGIVLDGDKVTAVRTAKEEIQCDMLVVAAGVGTTELASMAGIEVPQKESPGFLALSRSLPPVFNRIAVLYLPAPDSDTPEVHMKQLIDGSVMLGSSIEESARRDGSQQDADDFLSRAARYVPALQNAEVCPMPMAYRPMPVDGHPVIGFTEAVPNLYVALTHSGVTLAPVIGELAMIEIVDGANVDILEPFRLNRFEKSMAARDETIA